MISPNIDVQEYRQAIGILANRSDIEQALQVLKDNEFPMEQVSVIAQDSELEDDVPPSVEIQSQIKSPVKKGAATGGTVGAISGLLVGLGTIAIPGLGPVMLAGVTATTLMTSILGAATGGLIGALVRMRIPEKDAAVYNNFVAKGYYILLVEGIMEEIQNAETILTSQEIQEWKVFFKPEPPRATKKNLS
ncbi:DUF1269 domain-containing protein (plasmid) [Acaryochloris sp. 'Moss Beach']|uniref:DUF1269 domain-containing protein n=1 Tax=Acaryochloris TaxID=155977 RepID=UPI001BAF68BD|nr:MULTISPECIES: DUF1269 domain-containing protein [Acaryochloris]QUY45874.1 DUF1269 domain-containing protein [Acaryochloris marina S15]UJB72477.1 DUF1269 domain-containing protein [Acaryochloris sp. 'Moss Beach']